jgi:hypothetical protein
MNKWQNLPVTTIFQKFFRKVDFGQFKNVQNGKVKKSFEKRVKIPCLDHNGLIHRKNNSKNVTIFFKVFLEKYLEYLSVFKVGNKWQ